LPERRAWVFGSRVRGTAHRFSDLDLALEAPGPIEPGRIESLLDAFSESDLPILIDIVDLRTVSETFRRRIEDTRELL